MRTSLIETQNIDHFLFKRGNGEDRVVFEARMLLDAKLAEKLAWQKRTMELVMRHSRDQLREEIARVDQQMFREPAHRGFRKKILSYFK